MSEIRLEASFSAKPEHVYAAFTNEVMLNNWMGNSSHTEVRVNGYYTFYWQVGHFVSGLYSAVDPGKRLVCSWYGKGDQGETEVEVLFNTEETGMRLIVIHRGFGTGREWLNSQAAYQRQWEQAFADLTYYLQSGLDRRIMMRPMLGVLPGELDASRKQSHGLQHVDSGVFLTSIVPGGGADRSGLKANDVLVEMEGDATKDYFDMDRIIRRHQAGDTIPVIVWRGKEKLSFSLTFGQRPVPVIPQTHGELIEMVQKRVEDVKGELDEILAGLPEEIFAFKPAAGEWSLKEQLAHLIVAERANSYYDWMVINGESVYPYGSNDSVHLAFGASGYNSGAEMLEGLKRVLDENVAVAAGFPESVTQNQALLLTIGNILTFTADHVRTHYQQMRDTIVSARASQPA